MMKLTKNTTNSFLALTFLFFNQSTFAMDSGHHDPLIEEQARLLAQFNAMRDNQPTYPLRDEKIVDGIPRWMLEESLQAASNQSHSRVAAPQEDIPDWILQDYAQQGSNAGKISEQDRQMIEDEQLAEVIAKSKAEASAEKKTLRLLDDEEFARGIQESLRVELAPALDIIRYDPVLALQEQELSALMENCIKDKEIAEILVSSFLMRQDLAPSIIRQANDILLNINTLTIQPPHLPRVEEIKLIPSSIPVPKVIEQAASSDRSIEELKMIELTNAERKKVGKSDLKINILLTAAARKHSENMARLNQFAHEVEGKSVSHRVSETGYPYSYVGENLSYIWGERVPFTDYHYSVEHSLDGLMNSPGHKANILHPAYTEIGIGIHTTPDGRKYFTQVFGTPR